MPSGSIPGPPTSSGSGSASSAPARPGCSAGWPRGWRPRRPGSRCRCPTPPRPWGSGGGAATRRSCGPWPGRASSSWPWSRAPASSPCAGGCRRSPGARSSASRPRCRPSTGAGRRPRRASPPPRPCPAGPAAWRCRWSSWARTSRRRSASSSAGASTPPWPARPPAGPGSTTPPPSPPPARAPTATAPAQRPPDGPPPLALCRLEGAQDPQVDKDGRPPREVVPTVATLLGGVALALASALPGGAAPATQPVPPNTEPGVCDEYAGDPDPGTPAWTARDLNNVGCSYQRRADAQASPAFQSKTAQQTAVEIAEFTSTLAEWAAEPNRIHANCCTSPQAKVADPFRSPEEWAAARRGRQLKFSIINRNGAKIRARLFAPLDTTRRFPALTFTPGLQSYNEVNAWFAEGMAEAGYVVLIVDPQGQGDSENCGHTPDGAQTTCPATNQPVDTRSAIDFVLSTPASPYPWALGANAAGTPTFNPFWRNVDPSRLGIAGHSLGAIAVTPIGQEDPRVDAVVAYDNLDLLLDPATPRRTPSLFFGTDYDL